jgi:hypothetical protein
LQCEEANGSAVTNGRAGSFITAGSWIAKGIASAVVAFMSFQNRAAQTV